MQCDKRCFNCQCRIVNVCLEEFYEVLGNVLVKVSACMEEGKYDELLKDVNVLQAISYDLQFHFLNLQQQVQKNVEPLQAYSH